MPPKKERIGNFEIEQYAAEKPVALTRAGDFVTPSELIAKPELALGSLFALSEEFPCHVN